MARRVDCTSSHLSGLSAQTTRTVSQVWMAKPGSQYWAEAVHAEAPAQGTAERRAAPRQPSARIASRLPRQHPRSLPGVYPTCRFHSLCLPFTPREQTRVQPRHSAAGTHQWSWSRSRRRRPYTPRPLQRATAGQHRSSRQPDSRQGHRNLGEHGIRALCLLALPRSSAHHATTPSLPSPERDGPSSWLNSGIVPVPMLPIP